METEFLPQHLRKYVVEQNYEKYTPVDQAVWRYIMRQLKAYLSVHSHECYVDGLEKTGVEVERIPRIEDISAKLQKFGWRALPVSGFIPPAAFMELQSLGVLPIASDMRTLDHLLYTPAPDIVHEAAGHAPILIHPEFSHYLRQYAQVAKKAIISKEDLDIYEAIRELSDIKENPASSTEEIKAAEEKLEKVGKQISHISEASELSRMNWWTAEYGLIGDLKNPKIFGAGLLSSVGESKWCLSDKVKKIPLTVDCIKMSYDITEPQPQLFVTPDFETLSHVLEDMASHMAFRTGGIKGLNKAIQAESINTAELNSGIQISGQIIEAIKVIGSNSEDLAYLRFQGPSQLCFNDKELDGHDKNYHAHGFGTPVGFLKSHPGKCPSTFTEGEWSSLQVEPGKTIHLEYTSGVVVTGTVQKRLVKNGRTILISLENAKAEFQGHILFDPEWGLFDMAIGSAVTSVFGGPADRVAYGEIDADFVAKRVPVPKYSEKELAMHEHYGEVRKLRENNVQGIALSEKLKSILNSHRELFPEDWLLPLEALELIHNRDPKSILKDDIQKDFLRLSQRDEKTKGLIQDGLTQVGNL
ncbi:MAG: aromatic amino acid hydroxylase [Pseudobdellovibrionaceae bacterium]